MSYYKFLKFPFECVNKKQLKELEDCDLIVKTTPAGRHWRNWGRRTDIITDALHTLLQTIDCEVLEAEVFYTVPYGILPWHIDMNPPRDNVKLNFVWGSDNHEMQFGEITDFSALTTTSTTAANSQYVEFTPLQVTAKQTVQLIMPALVNSGRPHRIVNKSNQGRWCLSVIITKNNSRILFDDAVNMFSEYVLD